MSKTLFTDHDDQFVIDAVVDWCHANDLRPGWIPAGDVFLEGDVIRYREVVPAEGEPDVFSPNGINAPTEDDEFARLLTDWKIKPLAVDPSAFGVPVVEA